MAMVCPQCRKSYDQLSQCPACRVSLLFQANVTNNHPELDDDSSPNWQQTPWGRMVVGVILAQGLAYGLFFLLSATLQSGAEFAGHLSALTTGGVILWHAVQGVGLIVGGMIAGAGRRRGYVYGSLVGFGNSLVSIGIQSLQQTAFMEMLLFQPIIHMGFGAIGGFVGWLIWKPLPVVEFEAQVKNQLAKRSTVSWKVLAGPIHWLRVFAGTGLVVCGVVWASSILEFVVDASEGNLRIESHVQARLVSLEVSALAVLVGGALAGATTFNGLKQGLIVGFFSAMVLLGFLFSRPETTLELMMSYLVGIFFLATVGGWFGRQLFPPIMSIRRKRIAAS